LSVRIGRLLKTSIVCLGLQAASENELFALLWISLGRI